MTASEALDLATAVLDGEVTVPGGHAPRAAAVLARSALEELVDEKIGLVAEGLERATMRSRLIILRDFLGDQVGGAVQAAWERLSQCCHHHSYELQPTAREVGEMIATVRELDGLPDGPPSKGTTSLAD